jgi:two-component system, cell cycle response regulator DivK
MRVLIVDDDPDARTIVCDLLSHAGYHVRAAASGREALREIETEAPDLVVLDLQMPGIDGWAVLDDISFLAASKRIRVVVVSAHLDSRPLRRRGVAASFAKPVDLTELLALVDSIAVMDGHVPSH